LIGACYLGSSATQGALAALLITGAGATWNLCLVAALNGALAAFIGPAWQGAIPDTVPKAHLQQANALFSITGNSASIAGAVLAGLLVAAINAGWALVIDAASFVIGAALVLRIPSAPLELTRSSLLADLRVGWQEFTARTWVWVVVAQFSIYNLAYAAGFSIYAPVIAKRDLGGAHAYGLIVAALGIGSVVGGLSVLRRTPRRPMLVAVSAILASVPVMAFLAAGLPLAAVLAAAIVCGASFEIFSVLWESALQTHIPSDRLSRVSSYDSLGSFVFAPVGAAVAGPIAVALGGVHAAAWLMVALMTVPTIAVLLVPDIWRVRASE
jgi:MFS family permease